LQDDWALEKFCFLRGFIINVLKETQFALQHNTGNVYTVCAQNLNITRMAFKMDSVSHTNKKKIPLAF
jgi:hypothetical protein